MSMKNSKLPSTTRLNYAVSATPPTLPETVQGDLLKRQLEATAEAIPRTPTEATAILVCHGMGEQVRYETLGQLAASLLRTANPSSVQTGVTISRPGQEFIAHAEIAWSEIPADSGTPMDYNVHLFEAYWAPITEGRITYLETIQFLVDAARKGLKSSSFFKECTFERWMFGRVVDLPIAKKTKLSLIGMLIFLAVVCGLIFVLGLQLASQLKIIQGGHLTWATLGKFLLPFLTPGGTAVGVVVSIVFWGMIWLSLKIRTWIIEYAGDVAAYISPYKASKFQDIRNQIQAVGFNVASLIYGFTPANLPHYKRVIVVGHSLGSVVAYDTLNAMLTLDQTSPTPVDVIGRTRSLVTFGSPLDKTAFLFRNQPNTLNDPLREQMAAGNQPLIFDYSSRSANFKWINIWAPADIISGSLEYYDDVKDREYPRKKVCNLKDPDARKPILAHTQYWDNLLLTQTLLTEIRGSNRMCD